MIEKLHSCRSTSNYGLNNHLNRTLLLRQNLSNSAAEKLPRLETLIFIKNAEDVIEGIVKDFYSKQEMTSELLIVDCGSSDQTHRILERLARRYLGMKFILLSDLPLNSCIQEALKYTSSPALLLIDCKSMSSKEILKSLALVSKISE